MSLFSLEKPLMDQVSSLLKGDSKLEMDEEGDWQRRRKF
jgi:hypothetical protein